MNGDNTTLDMLPNNYIGSQGNGGNGSGFVGGGGGGANRGKQMNITQNKSLGFSKVYDWFLIIIIIIIVLFSYSHMTI